MCDLISRQAAVDVASGYCHLANVADELRKLPSAQPEITRCKDCKKNPHWEWVGCPMTGKDTRKPEDYCSYAERRTDEKTNIFG